MRSFSFLPSRLILVPSALQSHALVPFRPTSSPSAPPVTYPFTIPSHIIPVSPSSHTPFYLSVPHHPRQPSSHTPFYLSVSRHPRQSSSHIPFYLFISLNISSHLCVFSPLVLDTRGKCREFPRKRFTFPRGRQGYRLHRPLSPPLQSLPPGKVPGISAKTVHFPPQHEVPSIQAL